MSVRTRLSLVGAIVAAMFALTGWSLTAAPGVLGGAVAVAQYYYGDPAPVVPPPPATPATAAPPVTPGTTIVVLTTPTQLEKGLTASQLRARIGKLAGIKRVQRGKALTGRLTLGGAADRLTVEALVKSRVLTPAAAAGSLTRIGVFTKRGVKAGNLSFRVPLSKVARATLAKRGSAAFTVRITLKVGTISGVRSTQVTWKAPSR